MERCDGNGSSAAGRIQKVFGVRRRRRRRRPNPVQSESVTILSNQSIRARGGASAVVISLDNLQKVIAAYDVPALQGEAAGPIF